MSLLLLLGGLYVGSVLYGLAMMGDSWIAKTYCRAVDWTLDRILK